MEESSVRALRIEDFSYPLPPARIAAHPCQPRDACRLLAVDERGGTAHMRFYDLPALLAPGSLLVANNTRVINARLEMHKSTGARVEIFCLEPLSPRDYESAFASPSPVRWQALVGNLKKWKEGELEKALDLPDGSQALLRARYIAPLPGAGHEVELSWQPAPLPLARIIEAAGEIPIPPYLERESQKCDQADYQTVYSRTDGSVAAPTAGLHFTPALLHEIEGKGIERAEVTLHVGAGTFQPVKSDTIGGHPMHTETFTITPQALDSIIGALERGSVITAVGTTSVRTLESLPYLGRHLMRGEPLHVSQWEPYGGEDFDTLQTLHALRRHMGDHSLTATTAIMIAPGFRWRMTGAMVTNFHQPCSTLLLLVSSFLDRNRPRPWRDIYARALEGDYRFLSYVDAMYIN